MVVHTDIIKDFRHALADLDNILAFKPKKYLEADFEWRLFDAQVFCFLRTHEVLKALLYALPVEQSDDQQVDAEKVIDLLCVQGIITECLAQRLKRQCEMRDFFSIFDSSCLRDEEEVAEYKKEVAQIPSYYDDMNQLLNAIITQNMVMNSEGVHHARH